MRALLVAALLLGALGFSVALDGCASGADGLRQGCANTDAALESGYRLATAEMRRAEAANTAHSLLGCFSDLVAVLDSGQDIKKQVCADPDASRNFTTDTASVINAGSAVAGAVSKWQACSASVLKGGL